MPGASVIAVVFDFDDTLVPDTTSKLLEHHGIDPTRFWTEDVKALIDDGYDPAPAYLKLFLDQVGDGKPFGALSNARLKRFGESVDEDFYDGLPEMFDSLRGLVAEARDVSIEFYIVSGGLAEIIRGSSIVDENFAGVYACELGENEDGVVSFIKRAVTFTEKTRYLFEINKGIEPAESQRNPLLVNKNVEKQDRRVPFENMIYVGDGMTDIPCFSLVKASGGVPFGVFRPGEERSAKQALADFLKPERVVSMHAPRYRPDDELGSLIRAQVGVLVSQILVSRGQAAL